MAVAVGGLDEFSGCFVALRRTSWPGAFCPAGSLSWLIRRHYPFAVLPVVLCRSSPHRASPKAGALARFSEPARQWAFSTDNGGDEEDARRLHLARLRCNWRSRWTGLEMTLSEADIEAVAARVADLLRSGRVGAELVDAAEIARRFGVSRDFVYGHADDLGAVRLGDGPKARLRFDPANVGQVLRKPREKAALPPRRQGRNRGSYSLLPVRGRERA